MKNRQKQAENRKALLGKKIGMSQVWNENGFFVPVTVVEVDKNFITQIRVPETDGYHAIQLAYGDIESRKVSRPLQGHFKKAGVKPRRHVIEIATQDASEFELGQEILADVFTPGDMVDVSGTTKGKGFAGVMKRHGFAGVSSSHGAHKNHRKPGSIGACATPGRVFKGLRMAGRMGGNRQTTQNLYVQAIDVEKGWVIVKGAIPGPSNGIVLVRSAIKREER